MIHSNPQHRMNQLIYGIAKAIDSEYTAITYYDKLAELVVNEETRDRVLEIRDDEIKHYKQFMSLYEAITKKKIKPMIIKEPPTNFEAGCLESVKDELMSVDDYLEIADMAQNNVVKTIFTRAAMDEQNHASWFLYFLEKD